MTARPPTAGRSPGRAGARDARSWAASREARGGAALPGLPALPAAVGITLLAVACGGGDGESASADGGEGESVPDSASVAAPRDTASGAARDTAGARRPLHAFRVLIRNRGGDTAVVDADAGAGAVAVDTVPPGDSSAVRVETRAARLQLRARGADGRRLARSRYELDRPAADSVLEFEVPAPPDSGGG